MTGELLGPSCASREAASLPPSLASSTLLSYVLHNALQQLLVLAGININLRVYVWYVKGSSLERLLFGMLTSFS